VGHVNGGTQVLALLRNCSTAASLSIADEGARRELIQTNSVLTMAHVRGNQFSFQATTKQSSDLSKASIEQQGRNGLARSDERSWRRAVSSIAKALRRLLKVLPLSIWQSGRLGLRNCPPVPPLANLLLTNVHPPRSVRELSDDIIGVLYCHPTDPA